MSRLTPAQRTVKPPAVPADTPTRTVVDTGRVSSEGKRMICTSIEVMPGIFYRSYDWK